MPLSKLTQRPQCQRSFSSTDSRTQEAVHASGCMMPLQAANNDDETPVRSI